MHRIIKSYLNQFSSSFSLDQLEESKKFEHFVNYCIVADHYSGRFSTLEITNDGDDAGIDGIAFLIDGELVSTPEMAQDIFRKNKRNFEVDILFSQAKTTEGFEKSEISNFGDGICDFLSEHNELPHSEFLTKSKEIFNIILDHIGKIKDGRPNAKAYYVTTGIVDTSAREIIAAGKILKKKVHDSGYFTQTDAFLTDRDAIIKIYSSISNGIEATLQVNGYLPYPAIPGVEESYISLVSASEYVKSLLNDDGKIRTHIFEENVRAFLGVDNPVNKEMKETILKTGKNSQFGILNNGITIISPDVRVQSNSIYMKNYQIVNGCQTSNVLFDNREKLDGIVIPVKIIEAKDTDIVDDIVKATNNQSKVDKIQFLSSYPIIKRVEQYFTARNAEDPDIAIYLERRDRQFAGSGIPEIRIIDIKTACKCVTAMFLERPDLASRYPNQMFEEASDQLLNEKNKEIIYYSSALAKYRLELLMSSQRIPSNLSKCKWHLLLLVKYIANNGKAPPQPNSKKIDSYCENITAACKDPEFKIFKEAADILNQFNPIERDKLRLINFTTTLLSKVKK
ncbi:AIPR family protein [Chromobacterium violaceum]|uniref:AIPR family protein n=1 Tax=Chromobacterium violaceum TaxID=536 RepID=UPI001CE0AA3C|nr:AIPR family protein [Chromobacterium violaceum]